MMPTSPNSPDDFIPLNRTFHELSSHVSESDDVDLSQAFYVSDRLTWEDLLKSHRVVILSEAGSGKTQEIRHKAEELRSEKKDAFFLRLENLPQHFDVAFEVGKLAEFEEWLASNREGWILLDSVDEARLRHVQDFELAIRKLGDKLALALDRTHIVLTGRTSAWRPKTDLDKCIQFLGIRLPSLAHNSFSAAGLRLTAWGRGPRARGKGVPNLPPFASLPVVQAG